jgi:hypothetical protein
LFAYDPEDPKRVVIACTKSNLGPTPDSLAYEITVNDQGIAAVLWRGTSSLGARALLFSSQGDPSEEPDALGEAMAFLRECLNGGPKPASTVRKEAREAGISERTLMRAKRNLGVVSEKADFDKGWKWTLSA